MNFNSIDFLIFFPIVVVVYFIIPKKIRYIWLLVASYYFYMCWSVKYTLLIVFSTVLTYVGTLLIGKYKIEKKDKIANICLVITLILNLGVLLLFKYINFIFQNINYITKILQLGNFEKRFNFLLPVGISFYTFQTIGYTVDVYRNEIKPERNIIRYALFVSFFPQLVAGPIERARNLLPQFQRIEQINVWNHKRVIKGLTLILWGLFQKLVIADRVSLYVDTVINNCSNYGFLEISLAIFLFAIQIYSDFGGYSNIARGSAEVMGFSLMENFRQPYLASSIKDFWKRWHISLTTWFTDYVYIPLGGNRKSILRKYVNITIVFLLSGLWHGASYKYLMWGGVFVIYRIFEDIKEKCIFNLGIDIPNSFSKRIRNVIMTFILVDFAWVFFVARSFKHAIQILQAMVSRFYVSNHVNINFDKKELIISFLAILILLGVDIIHERGKIITDFVLKQEFWFKCIFYLIFIWSIIMLGIYGKAYDTSSFIYFQF